MRTSHLILIPALAAGLALGWIILTLPDDSKSTSQAPALPHNPSSAPHTPRKPITEPAPPEPTDQQTRVAEPKASTSPPSPAFDAPLADPKPDDPAEALAAAALSKQEQQREQQRIRAELQAAEFLRQATRIANELKLPTGSEQRIASIFIAEQEQVALVREQFRGLGPEVRQAYQDALAATRTKRDEELARYFGHELAKSISATPKTPRGRSKR